MRSSRDSAVRRTSIDPPDRAPSGSTRPVADRYTPHGSTGMALDREEKDLGEEDVSRAGALGGRARAWEEPETEESRRERALDHGLIRRAQAGEEAAFAELVGRHQQRAWRVARNLVPSDEDAQDLAQEAFLRVFRSLHTFDFEHGFTTWLYRIVTNLAIDHLRKRRPTQSTRLKDDADEGAEIDLPDTRVENPADNLEREELAQDVHAVLATLAPHFQSVLVLREIEGLPCNEIAKIVGATHVTVRWRLHRGRKLFLEEWERRARFTDQMGGNTNYDGFDDEGPSDEDEA